MRHKMTKLTGALAALVILGSPAKANDLAPQCKTAEPVSTTTRTGQNVYDVLRNGKKIGSHIVTFRQTGKQLRVDIETEMEVWLAFIKAFGSYYQASEVWCEDKLMRVSVISKDNGDNRMVEIERAAAGFTLVMDDEDDGLSRQSTPLDALPTSHWNADVLAQNHLMHTIKSQVFPVSVTPMPPEAYHDGFNGTGYAVEGGGYSYATYYDAENHWQGMAFHRGKNNFIEFKCVTCDATLRPQGERSQIGGAE